MISITEWQKADGNGISLTTPKGHLSHPLPKAHPITASLPVAEIGVGTTGFGIFFILFGVFLYFDSVLLAFGNESGAIKPGPARWLGIDSRSCWTENLRTWILTPSSG
nr:vesicle transport protein GOT1A isoform X3 [Desmodus rotundus]